MEFIVLYTRDGWGGTMQHVHIDNAESHEDACNAFARATSIDPTFHVLGTYTRDGWRGTHDMDARASACAGTYDARTDAWTFDPVAILSLALKGEGEWNVLGEDDYPPRVDPTLN